MGHEIWSLPHVKSTPTSANLDATLVFAFLDRPCQEVGHEIVLVLGVQDLTINCHTLEISGVGLVLFAPVA